MRLAAMLLLMGLAAQAAGQGAPAPKPKKAKPPPAALDVAPTVWRGDFEEMLERRVIRVVVPYSRSLYFNDKGTQRGPTADLL